MRFCPIIILQVFFPKAWAEEHWQVSPEAKRLLEEVAAIAGDPDVLDWIQNHNVFVYDGGVSGYVQPPKDGRPMRIALKRELLADRDSCRTWFAAGHEKWTPTLGPLQAKYKLASSGLQMNSHY